MPLGKILRGDNFINNLKIIKLQVFDRDGKMNE